MYKIDTGHTYVKIDTGYTYGKLDTGYTYVKKWIQDIHM